MRKLFLYLLITSLIVSCTKKEAIDLKQLEGYWEIEKVILPDGNSKEYTISQSIDYILLKNDSSGYRKKLQPKLDGSFYTSDDAEEFTIHSDNKKQALHYKNSLSEWKEVILKLNKEELVIINENNLKYFYKRFEKLNLESK
ncbi:hypothetical protein GTQ40_02620 [Flavobacteriaceae bacterium R38]|nr:hypothetical protein [Flavobacteriaceae bacterium R38]